MGLETPQASNCVGALGSDVWHSEGHSAGWRGLLRVGARDVLTGQGEEVVL